MGARSSPSGPRAPPLPRWRDDDGAGDGDLSRALVFVERLTAQGMHPLAAVNAAAATFGLAADEVQAGFVRLVRARRARR